MRAFFNHGVTWLFSARFLFKVIICSNITFKMKQNKMKQNTLWQSNLCKVIPRQSVPFYCILWAMTSFRYEFTILTSKFAIIFSANWMPNQLNLLQLDKGRCFDKRSFLSFQICLLDFGASRTYGKTFVDKYIKVRVYFFSFMCWKGHTLPLCSSTVRHWWGRVGCSNYNDLPPPPPLSSSKSDILNFFG